VLARTPRKDAEQISTSRRDGAEQRAQIRQRIALVEARRLARADDDPGEIRREARLGRRESVHPFGSDERGDLPARTGNSRNDLLQPAFRRRADDELSWREAARF
jgi:hypothetical protein